MGKLINVLPCWHGVITIPNVWFDLLVFRSTNFLTWCTGWQMLLMCRSNVGMHIRMCTIMSATSDNWNWPVWIRGGLAKCKIQFQSRRYEGQINKRSLPWLVLHTRMCTIMGATSKHWPHLIQFRNQPENGKICFQTRCSHQTQPAPWTPIDLLYMPGDSTKYLLPCPCSWISWLFSIPQPL
jgi:hypothetical protein